MNGSASQAATAQGAAYSPYDAPQTAHASSRPSPSSPQALSLEAQASLEAQEALSFTASSAQAASSPPSQAAFETPPAQETPSSSYPSPALSLAPSPAWEIEKPSVWQPIMLVLNQPMLCECGKLAIFLTVEGETSDLDFVAWCQSCFERDEEEEED